jgi:protein MAK11
MGGRLYDWNKKRELGSLLQHEGDITALEFFNKSHLLSVAKDGKLCIWRTKDWECLKSIKGHNGAVLDLAIHPTGKLALTVGEDRMLRTWDLTRGVRASALKLHKSRSYCLQGNVA